jgi:hypothetical protein
MNKHTACALYLSLLALPALAQTATPPAEPAAVSPPEAAALEAAPATVVVEGRRPGPGVWKVSKDGHVMWVFGLYSPLPKKMEWDAARVERLVAHSQEVLLPPGASIDVGFLRSLTLLPTMIGMEKNPDGAQLKDLVPADTYARWQTLKVKYIGNDEEIERYRPIFAGELLLDAGLKKTGLSRGNEVRKQIEKLARQNNVKLTPTAFGIDLKDPRATLKAFKESQIEDLACFTKTLDRLEEDIDAMRVRANAWANGNMAEITGLNYGDRDQACGDAVLSSPAMRNAPEMQNLRARIRAAWLKAAEKSLLENTSTLAVLQMNYIVGPHNYLADLQARGYTVESPK